MWTPQVEARVLVEAPREEAVRREQTANYLW